MTRRRRILAGIAAVCACLAVAACQRRAQVPARAGSTDIAPDDVMKPYLAIHDALAKDSLDGVSANATAIAAGARRIGDPALPLRDDAMKLQAATSLPDARDKFGAVSETLVSLSRSRGWKLPDGVREAYCPMAKKPWLQRGSTIANPYFGKQMPDCGEFK